MAQRQGRQALQLSVDQLEALRAVVGELFEGLPGQLICCRRHVSPKIWDSSSRMRSSSIAICFSISGKLNLKRLGGRLKSLTDFIPRQAEFASNILAKPLKLGGGRKIQVVLHPTILVDCRAENVSTRFVAHALLRAVSPLMATPVDSRRGVDKSVDAARMNPCATPAYDLFVIVRKALW